MAVEAGTVVGGKYVVDRLIGKGGMGSVWLCQHATLDAPFAVKILRPELSHDESARARFEREAKAAAALRTRHVVKVHDHGFDGENAYIVMEVLEGEDLRDRMMRQGRLSARTTNQIVVQAARALHYAHGANIVHRDLKPANIFLANVDGEEVVKILDFGIAKVLGVPKAGAATQTGSLLGSPHYMSPEQIRGHWSMVDLRTDLWALAVVAFRALTGQLPFLGDVVGDVMIKVCVDPIPTPSSIAPDLSPEIDRFFARALARDREDRFRSGLEMATALSRALGQKAPSPDPLWHTGSHSGRLSVPDVVESATATTRRVPESARASHPSLEALGDTTQRMEPDDDEDEIVTSTLLRDPAIAAGTLTDAGSLHVRASAAAPPRLRLAVVGAAVALAALVIMGVAMTQEPKPADELSAALPHREVQQVAAARAARPAASPEEIVSDLVEEPPDPEPSASAAPPVAPRRPVTRPVNKPTPKGKDSFSDRFGYE